MEKKSKKSIIIGITGLLLVTLTLLGLTYAYYRTRIIGNEANTSVSVSSQKLEVTYQNESALVNVTGLEPGGDAIVKTFEVANTGNATATYSLWLEDMTNTFERNQDLQYALTKNGESVTGTLDHIAAGTHQILIPSVSIDADTTDVYELSIYYYNEEDIDQSEDMGSTLQFKINIQEEAVTWENASEGTLLSAISSASDVATSIGTTEDDYGISHYYKGNIENNFVNYSGMCWRIVRVQGDGTIKLVLADENHACDEEGYSSEYTGNGEASSYSGIINSANMYSYHTNPNWVNNNLYSGVLTAIENITYDKSDVPGTLNSWMKSKSLDTSKMVETEFCNETSINGYAEGASGLDANGNYTYDGMGEEIVKWYYTPLFGTNTNNSLKCNFKGVDNTTSTRITTNIAMLTLAEENLAAQNANCTKGNNYCYYLQVNATDAFYWLMDPASPGVYEENYMHTFIVGMSTAGGAGTMSNSDKYDGSSSYIAAIRPVIAVRSDVTITDGDDGTQSNPYAIG